MRRSSKILLIVVLLVILGTVGLIFFYLRRQEEYPVQGVSREAADQFLNKISNLANMPTSSAYPMEFSEIEINSFLYYQLEQSPVQGIKRLQVSLVDPVAVIRARVNFDELPLEKTGGKNILWHIVLHGNHNLELTALIETKDGIGQYRVQSAKFDQGELPKPLLNLLVPRLTSKRIPGLEQDGTFRLPKGIERIEIKGGKAIVYRKMN